MTLSNLSALGGQAEADECGRPAISMKGLSKSFGKAVAGLTGLALLWRVFQLFHAYSDQLCLEHWAVSDQHGVVWVPWRGRISQESVETVNVRGRSGLNAG